jgi:ABC-type uncharacterized transport system auxiliary subunit
VNKLLAAGLSLFLLPGCVELPGADSGTTTRYTLQGTSSGLESCDPPTATLKLSVVKVNAGLETDRIARRDARTGEITYLKQVRWIDTVSAMMEQRLAADLECRGYTVITSHHRRLSYDQLVCEVRALNLVAGAGGDQAEVGLSCIYFKAGTPEELALRSRHQSRLHSWRADDAVAAASDAYQQVFAELLTKLPRP